MFVVLLFLHVRSKLINLGWMWLNEYVGEKVRGDGGRCCSDSS